MDTTGSERSGSVSVEVMRHELKKLYHSAYKWVAKVNNMSDKQVIAVYYRLVVNHKQARKKLIS